MELSIIAVSINVELVTALPTAIGSPVTAMPQSFASIGGNSANNAVTATAMEGDGSRRSEVEIVLLAQPCQTG